MWTTFIHIVVVYGYICLLRTMRADQEETLRNMTPHYLDVDELDEMIWR